jgi:hypothetical protein
MNTYLVSIAFAQRQREIRVNADTETQAIEIVRSLLLGAEARWATVFIG